MSFAVPGITHCSKHHFEPLDMNMRCAECEREEKEREEKERQYREKRIGMLLSFSDDEIEALKCLVQDKAKEIKHQRIKSEINELQKQLEE